MPVDYTNLQVIKTDIDAKIAENRIARSVLQKINQNIVDIQKVIDPEFPEDRTKDSMPNDEGMGKKISQARTDGMYDKIVADHSAL